MQIQRHPFTLLLALLLVGSLAACDFGEQNFDFEPGDSLDIEGAAEVTVPDTTDYFVRAFTINKDYSWSVSGSAEMVNVRRSGEFIDVGFTEPGTYTIEVNDGEYTGTLEVTAVEPEE